MESQLQNSQLQQSIKKLISDYEAQNLQLTNINTNLQTKISNLTNTINQQLFQINNLEQ